MFFLSTNGIVDLISFAEEYFKSSNSMGHI